MSCRPWLALLRHLRYVVLDASHDAGDEADDAALTLTVAAVEPVVPARFLGSTLGAGVSLPLPEC